MSETTSNVNIRLSARIPDVSQLKDLVGQLQTEAGKIEVPGLPLAEIERLANGFKLTLPDTSGWSQVIVPDTADLLTDFPDPATLAAPLGEPLRKVREVITFDFTGGARRFQDTFTALEPPRLDSPKAFLDSLLAPLSGFTKFVEGPEIAPLLKAIGALSGAERIETLPKDLNTLVSHLQTTLKGQFGSVVFAVISAGAAITLAEKTERVAQSASGWFSLDSARARHEALLQAYGSGPSRVAELLRNLDVSNPAQVDAVKARLRAISEASDIYHGSLVRELAFSDASLAMLDLEVLQSGFQLISQTLAEVDTAPIRALAGSFNDTLKKIKDSLVFDGGMTISQYKQKIGEGLAIAKTELDKLEPGSLGQAFQNLTQEITQPLQKLEDFKGEVEAVVRGALQTVQDAIRQIDMTPLRNSFDQALGQLETKLKEIDALFLTVRTTIENSLNQVKTTLEGAKNFLLDPENGLKKQIETLFASVFDLLGKLNIQGVVEEISVTLKPISVELGRIEFAPVIDAAVEIINTIADVLNTVAPLLVTEDLKKKLAEATQFLRQIKFDEITKTLVRAFDEILASIDVEALGKFEAEYQKVVEAVDKFDPAPMLQELQQEIFDPLVTEMEKLKPAESLRPLQEGYNTALDGLSGFDPKATLSFITEFFDELTAKVHELSPAKLLEPIEQALSEIRNTINSFLRIDELLTLLETGAGLMLPQIKQFDLRRLLNQLEPGLAELKTVVTQFDPEALASPLAAALGSVFARLGINLNAAGIRSLFASLKSGRAGLNARFAFLQQSLQQSQLQLNQLDLKSDLINLRARHGELKTALANHVNAGPIHLELKAMIESLDPTSSLSPLLPKVTRVQAGFTAKSEQFAKVAQELAPAFQSIDQALGAIGAFLPPAELLQEMLLGPLRGLFPGQTFAGVKELLLRFLDEIDPAQWRAELESLALTLQAKAAAFFGDAVLGPVAETLNSIKDTIGLLNISALSEAINKIFAEVEVTIQQLNPAPLIQAMADTYQRILGLLAELNPAEFITRVDSLYTNDVIGVVRAISPEALLLPPLQEMFRKIKELLIAFNIKVIFEPILLSLQSLKDQLVEGLGRAGKAYNDMVAAIPVGGSVTVAARIEV